MAINIELPGKLPLTAEDYARLPEPEGVRIELSDGVLEMAAAQMAWHTEVARRICNIFVDAGRAGLRGVGVVLGDAMVRAPDVTRFRAEFKPHPRLSQFPADRVDLVVEVVSPESQHRDRDIKPLEYVRAHIPEFWLVEEDRADLLYGAVINIFQLTLRPGGNEYTLARQLRLSELEAEARS